MSAAADRRAAALARREAAARPEPSRDAAELVESLRPVEPSAPFSGPPTKPCKSCGAPVVWVKTAAGQKMPLDPPRRRGVASSAAPEGLPRVSVVDDGGRVVQIVEHDEGDIWGRVSHFATCPNASEHRRPREARGERRPAREPARRVAAVPALPAEPPPAPATSTEPAGARVAVVHAPIGPRCTIQTDEGLIVHGHRVPDGYRGSDLEVVSVGRCVRAWSTDKAGQVIVDEHGRTCLRGAEGGGVTLHRGLDASDTDHVVDAVPPPLGGG